METPQRHRQHLGPLAEIYSHGSPPAANFGAFPRHHNGASRDFAVMAVVLAFVLQLCGCRPSKADLVNFGVRATYANNVKIKVLESGEEIILTDNGLREITDSFASKNLEPLARSFSAKKLAEISFLRDEDLKTTMTYYEGSVLQEKGGGGSIFVKLKQDPILPLLKSVAE